MGLKDKKHKVRKNKNVFVSFMHAYEGIKCAIVKERNMNYHIVTAVLVIAFGAFFSISYFEWIVCILLIGLVFAFELINTSIESVVDMITTEENKFAKIAKDTSAGAVLSISVAAAIIGLAIFVPKVIDFLTNL